MTIKKKPYHRGQKTQKNHDKRMKKKAKKQEMYEKNLENEKETVLITKREISRAVQTAAQPGKSRNQQNDADTPKTYKQHCIRREIEPLVHKFLGVENEEEQVQCEETNDANITPTASYDFS